MAYEPTYQELQEKLRSFEEKNARLLETLRETEASEKLHRLTLENITDTVLITDDDGSMIYACPNTGYIFGLSQDEVYALGTIDKLMNGAVCDISELKSKSEITDIERTVKHSSGDERFVLINARSVNINGGTALYVMRDITERKRAEITLQDREFELKRTLDATSDGIWTWNFKTNALYFSPKYYTILGYEPDAFTADFENWVELIHPEDRNNALAAAKEYLKTKPDSYENEFRLRTKQGDYRWIRTRAHVVKRDENGEAVYMIGNHEDITDRKRSEDELRVHEALLAESNQILDSILEYTHMMAAFLDPQFNFIWVNRSYAKTCRLEQSFFPGKSHFDLYPHEENQKIFQQVVDTGKPFFVEAKPFEFPDQPERGVTYWDWSLIPVKDDLGKISGLVFTLAEVTDRIRAEEELRESEERFRAAFMGSPIAIVISTQEDGVWVDVNQAFLDMFGYTRDEVIGKSALATNLWFDPNDRKKIIAALEQGDEVRNQEVSLRRKDGSLIIAVLSVRPLILKGKKHLLFITEDITDKYQAEENYQMLFREMIDGFALHEIICDDNGHPVDYRFLDVNPAFERMTGLIGESLIGKTVLEVMPNTEPYWIEKYGQVALTGKPDHFENYAQEIGRYFQVTAFSPARNRFACIFVDITERIRAEETLRDSKAALAEAQKTAKLGSWTYDVMEDKPVWSTEMLLIFDRDPEMGEPAWMEHRPSIHPEDWERIDEAVKTAIDTGRSYREEFRIVQKDGTVKWAETIGNAHRDESGRISSLSGTVQDITDRKLAENALLDSEERYRNLVELSPDAVFVHQDDKFVYINPAGMKILKATSPEELIGKSVYDFIHPDWHDRVRSRVARLYQDKKVLPRAELQYITSEKETIHVEATGAYINYSGKPGILSVISDVTERKQAEEALRESEERYRNLVELSPDAVFVQQKDKFVYINPACMKILRVNSPEELIGKSIYDYIHPDWRDRVKSRLARLYKEKKVLPRAEQKYITAEREIIDVEAAAALIRYSGKPGVLCVIKDITDRKKAEEALRESEEIVRKKLEAILLPDVDMEVLELADIVDVQAVQEMMDYMYRLTDIGVAVLDLRGKVLVSTGWQDICTKFHRVHPSTSKNCIESDVELSSGVKPGEFKLYKCKNNMWDIVTPIVIGETHMGNLFLGQFFFDDEVPDRDFFLSQAVKYGFDEEAYLDALDHVPRWSRDTVNHVMNFYARFSNLISTLSYSNLKLARTLNEHQRAEEALKQSESRFKGFFENSGAYCYMVSPEGTIIEVNASALQTLGYAKEELIGRPVSTIYSEESLIKSEDMFEQWRRTGKIKNAELTIRCKSGENRTVLLNSDSVRDEEGRLLHSTSMQFDITEWRKMEERFRMMYEKSPTGVAIVDTANQGILQANIRFCEILGYSEDELKGLTIPDITHTEDWERELHQIRSFTKKQSAEFIVEKRYIRKDGSICWVKVVGDMLEFSDLDRQVAIACVEDITESKRALDALRDSEKRYRSLVDNLTLGVTLLSPELEVLAINDQFAKWYPEIETTNKPLCYHVFNTPAKNVPCSYCPVVRTLADGLVHEAITETPMGDAVKHFRIVSNPIKNEDGSIRNIIEIVEDLTEQHRKDRQLFEYKKAVESSKDVIAAVSTDYRYLFVNEAFLKNLRMSREEVEGESVEKILGKQAFRDQIKPQLERCFSGESVTFEMVHEYPEIGTRSLQVSYFPLKDDNDAITGAVGIIRDISEMKRVEEEYKRLEEHLRQAQKMEAIGVLAGGIAHDFNNILWGMLGFTEMSLIEAPEGSVLEDNLNHVLSAGHRAKELVQQILAFSRMSEQEKRPIDLRLIVNEALKLLRASIPTTIEITQNIAKKNTVVLADPTQIHQVIMNLCTNAAHAMEPGGGELNVVVGPVDIDAPRILNFGEISEGPYVKLTVRDTGNGMEAAMLERIFEPYFTTKEKGVGTGLGLSVVHGIVQSHGGVIDVFSEPGRGSVFDVYFPRIEKDILSEKKSEIPLSKGNERILFVDDEEALVGLVRRMLEYLGYEVTTRTNSMEALDLFRSQPDRYDLVMTDLTMPYMTGDILAQELLKIRSDIPVVLCTGFSEKISEERAGKIGIKAFVLKPLVLKDMSTTVRRVLDEK